MNYDIYRYIDGQMSKGETENFEKRLLLDTVLKKELDETRHKLSVISDAGKFVEADQTYFSNITVNFRNRLEIKRSPRRFSLVKYSFVLPALVITITASILFFRNPASNTVTLKQVISEYDDKAKNQLIDEYSDNSLAAAAEEPDVPEAKADELAGKQLAKEISADDESLNRAMPLNYAEFNQVMDNLSDKQENYIYNEMINKKIL